VLLCTCHPSYSGGLNRGITVQTSWAKKPWKPENNWKQKGLGAWLMCKSACLANERPWVQSTAKWGKKEKHWVLDLNNLSEFTYTVSEHMKI
jgi:hypothetical protein